MKLINIESGRVIQLWNADEVRPRTPIYMPDLVRLAVSRYGFVKHPSPPFESAGGPAKFEHGKIRLGSEEVFISSFELFRDGMIVDCPDTEAADRAADDFISWGNNALGFRTPETVSPRRHLSTVIVELNSTFDRFLGNAGIINSILEKNFQEVHQVQVKYSVQRFSTIADPATLRPNLHSEFLIERRADTPYNMNRYFSVAPYSTQKHLETLEQMEAQLVG